MVEPAWVVAEEAEGGAADPRPATNDPTRFRPELAAERTIHVRAPSPDHPPRRTPRRLALACVPVAVVLLAGCDIPSVSDDRITSFDVEADLDPSGTLTVSESITYDFGPEPSPGLRRELPTVAGDGPFMRESLDIDVVSVESPNGAPAEIESEEEFRGWLILEIGDSANEVTGEQTYTITYTVAGAVTDEGTHDELYWDFIGTDWGVPIQRSEIRLTAPDIDYVECAAGELDSTRECDSMTVEADSVTAAESNLDANHALTARVEMPPGTIDISEPSTQIRPLPTWLTWTSTVSMLVALAFFALNLWLRRTMRKRRGTEKREFDTTRISPAAAGVLVSKREIRPQHLTGMLVDLEERGFITSRKHRKKPDEWVFEQATPIRNNLPILVDYFVGGIWDWVNTRRTHAPHQLSPAEARFLGTIFAEKPKAGMGTLRKNITTHQVHRIRKALIWELQKGRYIHGPILGTLGAILGMAAFGGPVLLAMYFEEAAPFSLNELHLIAIVIAGFGIVLHIFPLLPIGATRAGKHAREALKKVPAARAPAHLVAVGKAGSLPEDGGFFTDSAFHRDWDRRMRDRVRRANRSRGGGSGSTRSGRGRGGGGGGRR